MSGKTITRYVLTCDGCGKSIGENGEFVHSLEARAAAWSQGWRMPLRVLMGGKEAKTSSDVCADCLPEWKPEPSKTDTWKRRRGEEIKP